MLTCKEYAELDDKGEIIYSEDGGMKIKKDKINECQNQIFQLKKMPVSIPDVFFSLEELQDLNLTMEELATFLPFIK